MQDSISLFCIVVSSRERELGILPYMVSSHRRSASAAVILCRHAQMQDMAWILESSGEATYSKDYESMNTPIVELMTMDDFALAVKYLNPSLTDEDAESLFEHGA